MAKWTDRETAKALRAADEYDRSWRDISRIVFEGERTPGAIRKKVYAEEAKPESKRLDPGAFDADIPERPEPEEGEPVTENAGLKLNEGNLDYVYIPAGSFVTGEELDEGVYGFTIDGEGYQVPEGTWNAICADYSEMGGNLTQKECARKYGVRYSILKRMLRMAGQFKASLPFSERQIANATTPEDFEALEEAAIEVKEAALEDRVRRGMLSRQRTKLRKLERERKNQEWFLSELREIAPNIDVPPVTKIETKADRLASPWACHAPTADEHIGKLSWDQEVFGGDYDTPIGCERLQRIADEEARWIADQPGRCRVVYRTFVGDLLHALFGQTENETRLDMDTRPSKVWEALIGALVYSISRYRQVADRVVVKGAKGNHDGTVEFFQAMHTLKCVFEAAGADDVVVDAGHSRFSYFREADSIHVLDHGRGVSKLTGWKAQAQSEHVARATAGDDFREASYIWTYYGHLHERQVGMSGAHHEMIRLPAVCETDDYETSLRYHQHPVAEIFRLDERGRVGAGGKRFWLDEVG